MAEGYLRKLVAERSVSGVEIQSAALYYDAGYPATEGARAIGLRHGFDLGEHRSQVLDEELFAWADIIFVMTRDHRAHLLEAWGEAAADKIRLLGSFDPLRTGIADPEIADPYGSRAITYDDVFAQIRRSIEGWLETRVTAGPA